MFPSKGHGVVLAALTLLFCSFVNAQSCVSFGIDFQDGGSYFQNSLSHDNFTFVSEYEGCNNDTAYNILVDPSGTEYQCTNTPLLPSDTPELSTCPIEKDQLVSGAWSILILSNNGNGDSIAYERDFNLTVGPQQTTTYTPTVTMSSTTTPIVNSTTTTTTTTVTTLPPSTVTSPASVVHPTTTVTPRTATTTVTTAIATLTIPAYTFSVSQVVIPVPAFCTPPPRTRHHDHRATIRPTMSLGVSLRAFGGIQVRGEEADLVQMDKAAAIEARDERVHAFKKRAPDAPTITVTDMNTADYVTTTVTSTAPASTMTYVSVVTATSTQTPPPSTALQGTSTAAVVTVTAPTPYKTRTIYTVATTNVTFTQTGFAFVTTTSTAPGLGASCTRKGGHF